MNCRYESIMIKFFFVCICWTFNLTVSVGQRKITLQESINYALEHNLTIKRSNINEKISEQTLLRSKYERYPDLALGGTGQLNFGRSLDFTSYSYVNDKTLLSSQYVSSNVTLFQGFQQLNEIKANKYLLEANKSRTMRLRNDVTLSVIALYLKILTLKNQLLIAKQQDTLFVKQLEFDIKNFQMGKKMSVDVSRTKFQISKSGLNITAIQNDLNNSIADFVLLINIDPATELLFVEPVVDANLENNSDVQELFKLAVKMFPEIKEAEYNHLAAIRRLEIAKGGYYPRLSLSLNATSNYSRKIKQNSIRFDEPFYEQFKANLYQYASLNLVIPIFNRLSTKTAVNQARLQIEDAEAQAFEAKANLYRVINKSVGDFEASKKNYELSQEAFSSSKQTYLIINERYLAGLANSLDLYQAQNEMNSSQLDIVQARYEMIFRAKVIAFYAGRSISY